MTTDTRSLYIVPIYTGDDTSRATCCAHYVRAHVEDEARAIAADAYTAATGAPCRTPFAALYGAGISGKMPESEFPICFR